MIGRRRKNLPKWRYDFNCRKCDNIQFIDDDRVVRCDCFRPIPEPEEEEQKEGEPT